MFVFYTWVYIPPRHAPSEYSIQVMIVVALTKAHNNLIYILPLKQFNHWGIILDQKKTR